MHVDSRGQVLALNRVIHFLLIRSGRQENGQPEVEHRNRRFQKYPETMSRNRVK